ncbi:DUF1876 domain-containing protein [Streptomyces tricolor]|nr:DUF1876 domain-containing protein [Streptomyces tricolor]
MAAQPVPVRARSGHHGPGSSWTPGTTSWRATRRPARNPYDRAMPEIGDELAAGRACSSPWAACCCAPPTAT